MPSETSSNAFWVFIVALIIGGAWVLLHGDFFKWLDKVLP